METIEIPISKVKPFARNVRARVEGPELVDLMTSIKSLGILSPPTVQKKGKEYEVICGHRRLHAMKKLGWTHIPVTVTKLSKIDALSANISENLNRVDVSLNEVGYAFTNLKDKHGLTTAEIAARVGWDKNKVYAALSNYRHIPAKFRDKTIPNLKHPRRGVISLDTAMAVMVFQKRFKLTAMQREVLFEKALSKATRPQLMAFAESLGSHSTARKAASKATNTVYVGIQFIADKKKRDKWQEENGCTVNAYICDMVLRHSELKKFIKRKR